MRRKEGSERNKGSLSRGLKQAYISGDNWSRCTMNKPEVAGTVLFEIAKN